MQNKMRNEINSVIGDRMPVQEDRSYCHYVIAFIWEGLRYRPVVPIGFPHKNVVQSKISIHLSKILSKNSIIKVIPLFLILNIRGNDYTFENINNRSSILYNE